MPIRIHPHEIEIPDQTPFANDELNRQDTIQTLTTLIGNTDGPCVMAVDASWGMGKTTFLRMWAQYLRNEGFPVVDFNAWETDYAGQPFVALTSEITDELKQRLHDPSSTRFKRLVESSSRVLNGLSAPAVRLAASTVPLMGNQLVQEFDGVPTTLAEAMAADYRSMKAAMTDFRTHLEKAADDVVKLAGGHPVVVFVDELDRCRPTYAIELLETAKHFFNVDHVVFVLCLDREQLAHSVKAVYGNDFAANGYLRRFFDIDYRLPAPNRSEFVKSILDSLGISQHLENPVRLHYCQPQDPARFPAILDQDTLSLRDLQQMIHRLAIMLSAASPDRDVQADLLALLLVIRTVDPGLYLRIRLGNATDEDVITALSRSDIAPQRHGAAIDAISSGCIGHSVYLASGTLDKAKLPRAMRHLTDHSDRRETRHIAGDSSDESGQPQQSQTESKTPFSQQMQQERAQSRNQEYLDAFANYINDFFYLQDDEGLSIHGVRQVERTRNTFELLELFPDPAAP